MNERLKGVAQWVKDNWQWLAVLAMYTIIGILFHQLLLEPKVPIGNSVALDFVREVVGSDTKLF